MLTVEEQILTMTGYVRREYRRTPIEEMRQAYRLYVKGELCDARGQSLMIIRLFDPAGLGEVMQAFRRYRDAKLHQQIANGQHRPAEPDPGPTRAEIDRIMLDSFCRAYVETETGGTFADLGNALYDWLDGFGMIPFTAERKKAFMEQAAGQIRKRHAARAASGEVSQSERKRSKSLADGIKDYLHGLATLGADSSRQCVILAKQIAFRQLLTDLIEQGITPPVYVANALSDDVGADLKINS